MSTDIAEKSRRVYSFRMKFSSKFLLVFILIFLNPPLRREK